MKSGSSPRPCHFTPKPAQESSIVTSRCHRGDAEQALPLAHQLFFGVSRSEELCPKSLGRGEPNWILALGFNSEHSFDQVYQEMHPWNYVFTKKSVSRLTLEFSVFVVLSSHQTFLLVTFLRLSILLLCVQSCCQRA